jgi:hypothetical protein
MKKKITLFVSVIVFLFACTQTGTQNDTALQEDNSSTELSENGESENDLIESTNSSVSGFKFPTEKIANKSTDMYQAMNLLYKYFSDSLKWRDPKDFLSYNDSDEESYWRQSSFRLSTNKLTFDDGIQLFYNIYITDKKVDIQHNYLFNDDIKIWYAIFENTENFKKRQFITFCRVIEKDNYIKLIVDYDYWRGYDEITAYLNKTIKNKNYNDEKWDEFSLEQIYLFIETTL